MARSVAKLSLVVLGDPMIYAAEGAIVHHNELPMDPFFYGVIAMGIFITLALVTWSYRDVSNRNLKRSGSKASH